MGLGHSPRIVTDGLVFCLDAANARSYPGTGTTWTDLTANKYNGTLSNMSNNFSNDNGGSLTFDGADDLCRTTLPASELDLDCTVIVTCSVAAVGDSSSTANRAFSLDRTSGATKWAIGTRQGTTLFQFAGGGGSDTTTSYFSYSLNEIFQAAVVVSGSGHRLYKNGNLKSSGSLTGDSSSFSFAAVGCRIISNDRHWNGKIFNVTAYNRQLTDAEIRQNYLATKGRYQ